MHTLAKNLSDADVVVAVFQNHENYGEIIARYQAKLLRYIHRISNVSDEDCEDLLQEIFIKAYQNLRDYDPKQSFSSWIYRIAHNHVISNFRKLKARPEISHSTDDEAITPALAVDLGIEEGVDQQLRRNKILEALKKLEPRYREVMILRYFEDKSYEEISEILKKPIGTIGTLINRAHKQCKMLIAQELA